MATNDKSTNITSNVTKDEISQLTNNLYDLIKAFNSTSSSVITFNKNIATLYTNFA